MYFNRHATMTTMLLSCYSKCRCLQLLLTILTKTIPDSRYTNQSSNSNSQGNSVIHQRKYEEHSLNSQAKSLETKIDAVDKRSSISTFRKFSWRKKCLISSQLSYEILNSSIPNCYKLIFRFFQIKVLCQIWSPRSSLSPSLISTL